MRENWKMDYKVSDLDDEQRLELVCLRCKRLVYITKAMICTAKGREQLYLDEVERKTRCKAQGCNGRMTIELVRIDEMTGFVGGMG